MASTTPDLVSSAVRAFRSALVVACLLSLVLALEEVYETERLTPARYEALVTLGAPHSSMQTVPPPIEGGGGQYPLYIVPPRPHKFRGNVAPTRHPDVPPHLIHKVAPEYTDAATKARLSGIVIVEAVIDAQGNVRAVHIVRPLPFGLDQKAAEAVQQWKFRPATIDGRPVPVIMNLAVAFDLGTSR